MPRHLTIILAICALLASSVDARAEVPAEQSKSQKSDQVAQLVIRGGGSSQSLVLTGRDAHVQLIVTSQLQSGELRDVTRTAQYRAEPSGIVQVSPGGFVSPMRDGDVLISAAAGGAHAATIAVSVRHFDDDLPINFTNQIVPIFTKAGCNGGGCHGKISGQNGFRLSLLGFEPTEDYEHLVREARGRRLSPDAPEHSLLLRKATNMLPHGGGKRIDIKSDDYQLLLRWIRQGMPMGESSDPSIAEIEVFPTARTIPIGSEQQLAVIARYTDGSWQDVTRSAVYESSDKEMAVVDGTGHVCCLKQPGSVSVMVRYQAKVGVFQATLPLGAPVTNLPPERNFIDHWVFQQLRAIGMPPSDQCDDATFIRRVTLDIAGRLPSPAETESFVASKDPNKRDQCIDRLLDSSEYADYFANKWSALLRNQRSSPADQRGNYLFHDWIRQSLYENKPYDQFVREILTASGDVTESPPTEWYRHVATPAAELEDTCELFLGTRIHCAECHHHPYDKWGQKDYYSLAAFFSTVTRRPDGPEQEVIFARRAIAAAIDPKSGKPVRPAGLGAPPTNIPPNEDARQDLVDWMVAPENPLFARALANRYWKHFFNRGLVEPEDDLRDTNPATNPQLLAALATHFVQSGYDLKDFVRTICRSMTYQFSAFPNQYNAQDRQNYSRYYPKRLTAEVLLDSVDVMAGAKGDFEGLPVDTRAVQLPDNSFNATSYFLTVFGRPESSSACECERSQDASLAQSLHLLNSQDVLAKLSGDQARPAKLAADDSRTDEQKVGSLYLLAFSREPTSEELAFASKYLERRRPDKAGKLQQVSKRESYEDIIWALVNTKEFLFNH